MRASFLALSLALTATAALAQAPAGKPGAADPARIQAGTYALDPNHTQILFTVDHLEIGRAHV